MVSGFVGTDRYIVRREVAEKIALATTTSYKADKQSDMVRAQITARTLQVASDCGYEVCVVDGGSPDEFLRSIERYAQIIREIPGWSMGEGRRQAIRGAFETERRIITWSEPEKTDLMDKLAYCALPILAGDADFVVPGRLSLDSYPLVQQYAEKMGNTIFGDITNTRKLNLDIWFGPKMLRRELADLCFFQYKGELGDRWETLPVAVMNALLAGKNVIGRLVDYRNDPKQTEVEECDVNFHFKRLEQLNNLVPAIRKYWETHRAA